jgi:SecDF, P1 head subdomain
MNFRIFALLFMFFALLGIASADDSLYFYLECSPGQPCIDFARRDGKTESVQASPALVVGRTGLKSAKVRPGINASPSLDIELAEEAAGKLEKITGENIGKRLMLVFDNTILTAPTIQQPIRGGMLTIYSDQGAFWEKAPWMQNLVKGAYRQSGQSVVIYVIIAAAVLIAAFIFVLLPRLKRNRESIPE